jgi:iron complex outermembrane receptor protein
LLPSANLKFDLSDNLVARASASRTLTRPDYSALTGVLSLNDLALSGQGGNPNLKPITATNFDVALEWYFADRALLSVSGFATQFKDYVNFAVQDIERKNMTLSESTHTDVYSIYSVSMPTNTNGTLRGVELAYQQPIGDHFGIDANWTMARGESADGDPLNGTSKNTYNLGGYFENERFNARVSYTFRSSFYAGVTRGDMFFLDDFGTLNASFGVKITDHLTISLDALNLNNPTQKYYSEVDGIGALPLRFYSNGRQYYAALRFKF